MKILEEIGALVKAIITTRHELASQREALKKLEDQFDRIEASVNQVRERLVRLETMQDANRARIEADLARLLTEFERAETRLTRLLPPPKGKKSS
jgi:septal ring factor EnvC (AmiA/AmiB activator)